MNACEDFDLEPPPSSADNRSPLPVVDIPFVYENMQEPLLHARTDRELGRAFLTHANLAPTTLKSTKAELGRFLLWCRSRNQTLDELYGEDLTEYRDWLRDPQPAAQWVSPTRWPRRDPRWRPFSGPLSEPSARQAFRIVKALNAYATNAGYLRSNCRQPGQEHQDVHPGTGDTLSERARHRLDLRCT